MEKYYKCIKCGEEYPFTKDIFTCTKHSPYYGYLVLMYPNKQVNFSSKKGSPWNKYLDLLPVDSLAINFDEQKTQLIKINTFGKKYGLHKLYVKDESKNPTGSFKDKESICAINKAIEWDIKNLFVVSSGNAAVSTAAYAQKAQIPCVCLIPKRLSVGKRFLISLYGGKIIEVEGDYEQIYRMAIDTKYAGWNCSAGFNPIKEEGIKIIGFEIWEDIGVPDVIVVPCGNGTLLFGIYKAFKELKHLGFINRLPKFVGVQIKDSSSLQEALKQGKDFVKLTNVPDSIAEGIIGEESFSAPKVMLALKDTHGEIIEVDENEVKIALQEIIQDESLIPEPTSAVVYAAVKKLKVKLSDSIVLIQSAGGSKNLKEIMETFIVNT